MTMIEVVLTLVAATFLVVAYVYDAAHARRRRHENYLRRIARRISE